MAGGHAGYHAAWGSWARVAVTGTASVCVVCAGFVLLRRSMERIAAPSFAAGHEVAQAKRVALGGHCAALGGCRSVDVQLGCLTQGQTVTAPALPHDAMPSNAIFHEPACCEPALVSQLLRGCGTLLFVLVVGTLAVGCCCATACSPLQPGCIQFIVGAAACMRLVNIPPLPFLLFCSPVVPVLMLRYSNCCGAFARHPALVHLAFDGVQAGAFTMKAARTLCCLMAEATLLSP